MYPKVSILVPVYGVEKYIERCARSLFEQTFENIEFIFVNDCTKDNSITVLEKVIEDYPNRKNQIKIINHEKNKGLAATRNTALDNSTGEYLMIVDSDDWLAESTVVVELVNKIVNDKSDIVVFDFKNIYVNKETICYKNIPLNKLDYLKFVIECKCTPSLATSFYKASLFKENGVRNINGINVGEDYSVQPRLIYYASRVSYIKKPLYCYLRINESSYVNTYKPNTSDVISELEPIELFFRSKPDFFKYKESLECARFHKMARRFVNWAKYSGDTTEYNKITKISGLRYLLNKKLSITYKCIILISQFRLQNLLRFLVKHKMKDLYGA